MAEPCGNPVHGVLDSILYWMRGITLPDIQAMEGRLMAQVDDLRAAISQVGVDLGEAVARVQAKIEELGEPDPDLTADIANLQSISTQLDSLVAASVEEPPVDEEPPVEEPPVEEPPAV